jgi:hypothetical protein
MDTPWWPKRIGQEATDKLRETIRGIVPLRVASTAEDVAEVVMFLASPASRNMAGELVVADAGQTLTRKRSTNPIWQRYLLIQLCRWDNQEDHLVERWLRTGWLEPFGRRSVDREVQPRLCRSAEMAIYRRRMRLPTSPARQLL